MSPIPCTHGHGPSLNLDPYSLPICMVLLWLVRIHFLQAGPLGFALKGDLAD